MILGLEQDQIKRKKQPTSAQAEADAFFESVMGGGQPTSAQAEADAFFDSVVGPTPSAAPDPLDATIGILGDIGSALQSRPQAAPDPLGSFSGPPQQPQVSPPVPLGQLPALTPQQAAENMIGAPLRVAAEFTSPITDMMAVPSNLLVAGANRLGVPKSVVQPLPPFASGIGPPTSPTEAALRGISGNLGTAASFVVPSAPLKGAQIGSKVGGAVLPALSRFIPVLGKTAPVQAVARGAGSLFGGVSGFEAIQKVTDILQGNQTPLGAAGDLASAGPGFISDITQAFPELGRDLQTAIDDPTIENIQKADATARRIAPLALVHGISGRSSAKPLDPTRGFVAQGANTEVLGRPRTIAPLPDLPEQRPASAPESVLLTPERKVPNATQQGAKGQVEEAGGTPAIQGKPAVAPAKGEAQKGIAQQQGEGVAKGAQAQQEVKTQPQTGIEGLAAPVPARAGAAPIKDAPAITADTLPDVKFGSKGAEKLRERLHAVERREQSLKKGNLKGSLRATEEIRIKQERDALEKFGGESGIRALDQPAPSAGNTPRTALKKFIQTVPEFKNDPAFVAEGGKLVFQDGGKFTFEPGLFGVDKASLKEGQRVPVDIESLGIKKPKRPIKTPKGLSGPGRSENATPTLAEQGIKVKPKKAKGGASRVTAPAEAGTDRPAEVGAPGRVPPKSGEGQPSNVTRILSEERKDGKKSVEADVTPPEIFDKLEEATGAKIKIGGRRSFSLRRDRGRFIPQTALPEEFKDVGRSHTMLGKVGRFVTAEDVRQAEVGLSKKARKSFRKLVNGSRKLSLPRGRRVAGIFLPQEHLIRQAEATDLQAAAHDSGHALHNKLLDFGIENIPRGARSDFTKAGRELYPDERPAGGFIREGVAEYVARRLFGEDVATQMPAAHRFIEETFFKNNPKAAKAFNEAQGLYQVWDDIGALGRIGAQINRVQSGPVATVKNAYAKLQKAFSRQMWVTDAASLESQETLLLKTSGVNKKDVLPSSSPSKVRRSNLMTAPGTARHFIEVEAVDTAGNRKGQSLRDALEEVRDDMANFTAYAFSRRSVDVLSRGINPGISLRDAQAGVRKLETPEFKRALDNVTKWSGYLMDYIQDSGGLSKEARDAIDALNPIYIPLKRFFDEADRTKGFGSGSGGNLPQGIKALSEKGSARPIIDPIDAFALQAEQMIRIGNKMQVAKAMAELAESVPGSGWFASKIETPLEAQSFQVGKIKKQLEKIGIELGEADLQSVITVFNDAQKYTSKDNVLTVWRNGKREFWEVDKDVFKVITEMDKEILPAWLMSVVGAPKRAVQLGAVGVNPQFSLIRNPFRDALSWTIFQLGKSSFKTTPAHAMQGLWSQLRKDGAARRFSALGGEMTTIMGQDRIEANRRIKATLATSASQKAMNIALHPLDTARRFLSVFESTPRIVEFRNILKKAEEKYGKGSQSAAIEARLAAKDVTVDFTRAGVAGRVLNQLTPFFNAKIQGASKFYRTFSGADGRATALRATGRAFSWITAPSIALWYINKDEKWYKARPNWEKFGFWMYSPDDGKTILRLPKPFELGQVFGSVPEAILNNWYQKGSDESRKRLSDTIFETMKSFLPINHPVELGTALGKPLIETTTNFDSFRGRNIESESDIRNKLPQDRYDDYTTETAKAISKWLNLVPLPKGIAEQTGPKKIEHLIEQHSGGAALDFLKQAESIAGVRKIKTGALSETPVIGTLFADPTRTPQQVTSMFEKKRLLEQKKGSGVLTTFEKQQLKTINGKQILGHPTFKALKRAIEKTEGEKRRKFRVKMNRFLTDRIEKFKLLQSQKKKKAG